MKILSHLLKPTLAFRGPAIFLVLSAHASYAQTPDGVIELAVEPPRLEATALGRAPVSVEPIQAVDAQPTIQLIQLNDPAEDVIDLTEPEPETIEIAEVAEPAEPSESTEVGESQADPMLLSHVTELRQMADAMSDDLDGMRALIETDPTSVSREMELRQMADAFSEDLDGMRALIGQIEARLLGDDIQFGSPSGRVAFDRSIYPRFRRFFDPTASARPGSVPNFR